MIIITDSYDLSNPAFLFSQAVHSYNDLPPEYAFHITIVQK